MVQETITACGGQSYKTEERSMQFYRLFSTIENQVNHLHIRNASASHAS